ncbi:hypothetical protein [Erysipelothrix aquatica]|uniref:hypothetical protein n=1 Tax=Erysipelothrix aquatica TaxID=2683714 RepID=UPI0013596D4C|nr:hypothetical protein [Erysipelothrix aquatica]
MNEYHPDYTPYDYTVVKLNKRYMDSQNLWYGVNSKRTVAAHELGHVMGLAHPDNSWPKYTIMAQGQQGRNVIGPTCLDHQSLKVRW